MILTILFLSTFNFAQSKEEVIEEGYNLYFSEMASWLGTDILFSKFSNLKDQIGGYFSYEENDIPRCIFVDRNENPKAILTIDFPNGFDTSKVVINTEIRQLSNYEKDLLLLRNKSAMIIQSDTLFKHYQNTNFNLIPIITQSVKKVFVLTAPQINGVVIIGNDYLLKFDNKNELIEKKPLHKNILVYEFDQSTEASSSYHSHSESTGEIITSTDICTLLLYGGSAKWEQHYVLSEKKVSIWNLKTKELNVIAREVWDKINSK